MNLQPGTILKGTYRIVRFIASGGFGCTYEAEHIELKARVAVKEFFVKDFCNRDATTGHISVGTTSKAGLVDKLRRKFKEEARAIWGLRHPGIVRVTDVFDENGTSYYVMDFIEGIPLNDMGTLPEKTALNYMSQVCAALAYVHAHNRLHLDIKPANIMVDGQGRAVLIDFGASKQYDEVDGQNTSTVSALTPGFAPIEQMDNDISTFTPATDIYSLGATLYNLLSDQVPPRASALASMKLPELPASVTPATRSAVESAMRLNKYDRPQSVAEFQKMLDSETVVASPVQEPASNATKPRVNPDAGRTRPIEILKIEKKRSNKGLIIGLAIGLAAVVIAVVLWPKPSDQPDPAEGGETVEMVESVEVLSPLDGERFTYSGMVDSDGLPDGQGKGIYTDGTYSGEYAKGLRSGKGVFTSEADSQGRYDRYEGTFVDDHYDNGRLDYMGYDCYFEGDFNADNLPAFGKYVLNKDGEYFYGKFDKNGESEHGNYYKADGTFDCGFDHGKKVAYKVTLQ